MRAVSRVYLLLLALAGLFVFTFLRQPLQKESSTNSVVSAVPSTGEYTRVVWGKRQSGCEASVAVMSIVNDASSWGEGGRTFSDYLEMLGEIEHPAGCLSLNLLVASKDEFTLVRKVLESRGPGVYGQVILIHRSAPAVSSRDNRKGDQIQRARRRLLAIVRNQLLYSTLALSDTHVLWIDSDIIKVPSKTLGKMIESGKDIIAAQCIKGGSEYDRNSWAGPRLAPTAAEWDTIDEGGLFVPRPTSDTRFMHQWQDTSDFMPLDSVGGTFLVVGAEVHRSGIGFTIGYVIGAGWERSEGYDGIETEGLCYIAKPAGYKCWGMPREIVVHSDR